MTDQRHPDRAAQDDAAPVTPDETQAVLLQRSRRDFAPIAKAFVQAPPGTIPRHGPLSTFVRDRDLSALRAQLLLYGMISNSDDGWSITLPLATWARAFDITATTPGRAGANATSKDTDPSTGSPPHHP